MFCNMAKSPHYSEGVIEGLGGGTEVRRLRAKHICFAK